MKPRYSLTEHIDNICVSIFRVGVIAKKFSDRVDKVEPWYGTQYKLTKITDKTITVRIKSK